VVAKHPLVESASNQVAAANKEEDVSASDQVVTTEKKTTAATLTTVVDGPKRSESKSTGRHSISKERLRPNTTDLTVWTCRKGSTQRLPT
jgi:hypothetical protein